MKEYKVINPKLGLGKWNEKLADILNNHAREGWVFKHINPDYNMLILERNKNR